MLKVLILHRPDSTPGGDRLTVLEYVEALLEIGVFADAIPADRLDDWGKPDFIHLWAACSPDWGLPVAEKAVELGIPLIITPSWWGRDIRMAFYGRPGQDVAEGYTQAVAETLKRATVLFCCTMSEAVECWKLASGIPILNRMMAHPPIKQAIQPAKDFVLCLGRIEAHKNQQSLAAACKLAGVKLICAGRVMHSQIADLAVQAGAEIREHLEFEQAMELLSQARVHALPSFSETPGLANMEAALLGVPGVMGTVGAEAEYFGEGGVYCNPWDIYDISLAIRRAWHKPRQPWAQIPTWQEVARKAKQWMNDWYQ